MNILDQIVLEKKNIIKYLKQKNLHARKIPKKKSLFKKSIIQEIKKQKNALIVEFKRFSPSVKNFKIFYSHEGLDEISLFSPTTFIIKDKSKIKKQTISQNYYKKYLNKIPKFSQIKGKDPRYNATRIFELFEGKKDTFRDMVLINSCHAMMLYKSKLKFQDCFDELSYALDNGNASRQLKLLQKK